MVDARSCGLARTLLASSDTRDDSFSPGSTAAAGVWEAISCSQVCFPKRLDISSFNVSFSDFRGREYASAGTDMLSAQTSEFSCGDAERPGRTCKDFMHVCKASMSNFFRARETLAWRRFLSRRSARCCSGVFFMRVRCNLGSTSGSRCSSPGRLPFT